MLAGGAPLAPETHRYLKTILCSPVLQGYGLTETCAATTVMDPEDNSLGIFHSINFRAVISFNFCI